MSAQMMAALKGRAVYINGIGVIGLVMVFMIVILIIGLLLFQVEASRGI